MDAGDDGKVEEDAVALDPRVRDFVDTIFDVSMMKKQMEQQNIDLKKMPLGCAFPTPPHRTAPPLWPPDGRPLLLTAVLTRTWFGACLPGLAAGGIQVAEQGPDGERVCDLARDWRDFGRRGARQRGPGHQLAPGGRVQPLLHRHSPPLHCAYEYSRHLPSRQRSSALRASRHRSALRLR